MGPFGQLLLVVGAMSVGTFVFGSLPLVLPLGRAKLRYVELVGSGLLLGAAFTVVIPEGVATVIRAADTLRRLSGAIPDSRFWRFFTDGETVIGTMLLLGFFLMFVLEQVSSRADSDHHMHHQHNHHHASGHRMTGPPHDRNVQHVPLSAASASRIIPNASADPSAGMNASANANTVLSPLLSQAGHHAHTRSYSSGNDSSPEQSFLGMPPCAFPAGNLSSHHRAKGRKLAQRSQSTQTLLAPGRSLNVETPRRHSHSVHTHHHMHHHHASECAAETSVMIGHSHRLSTLVPAHEPGTSLRAALASIVGLMIHALADGIAMGASASSTDEQLRWIVFGAILIHKAPTAFGLCSVLMARGLSKSDILKTLALFSLCTPVGAVVVYLALQLLFTFNRGVSAPRAGAATATAMVLSPAATIRQLGIGATLTFSGGTFLFVAMHALEDVTDSPGPDAGVGAQPTSPSHQRPQTRGKSAGGHGAHSHADEEHSALWIPSFSHASRMHGDEEQNPADGGEMETADPSGASVVPGSSSSSSLESESDTEAEKRLRREASQVSQTTRIALVFLGSLIPKMLQLATGGHSH